MPAYVALLRGINLGKRRLKMDELREAFVDWGFAIPQTILASGNVVFASQQVDPAIVKASIEAGMQASFGFASTTLIRSSAQIATLIDADPISGLPMDKDTKFHVTFLDNPLSPQPSLPYVSSSPDFEVHRIDDLHLLDTVHLGPKTGTLDLMDFLGKHFADSATTRTWNTVLKIHAKLESL